jgi:prepilin-type processing-associated H-X9-DG protein
MKSRNAFTLTELLVLIAAGALLGSVLLASLSDAKEKVQAAACLSNLREIGMAISMYANDNNDYYPPGYIGGGGVVTDWPLLLCPYIKCYTGYYSPIIRNKVFICPSVRTPSGRTTRVTYSLHIALSSAPNNSYPPPFNVPQRRVKVARPSELVLAADGNLGVPAGAPSNAYDAYASFGQPMITPTQPYNASATDNNSPLPGNDLLNRDSGTFSAPLGYIRWRHSSNTAANFLFCDGHGESLLQTQLKRRNLRYDP